MQDETRMIEPPNPALVVDILKQRAVTDPGLAVIIEAAEWKALYLEVADIASSTTDGNVTTTQPEGNDE